MPKECTKPGKLGDLFRAIGRDETARRLGWSISTLDKYHRIPHRRPDNYHEKLASLHREVCG